jgi:predicted enzyme related to lactoylglutathione lyase
MKGNIGFVELHTPDLDKSKRFYAELFDWRLEDLKTPGGDYALFRSGGSVDGGMMKDATPMWLSYIAVEQLEAAVTRAKALGARVLREKTEVPETGWFTVLSDPAGAPFALWQDMARRG